MHDNYYPLTCQFKIINENSKNSKYDILSKYSRSMVSKIFIQINITHLERKLIHIKLNDKMSNYPSKSKDIIFE